MNNIVYQNRNSIFRLFLIILTNLFTIAFSFTIAFLPIFLEKDIDVLLLILTIFVGFVFLVIGIIFGNVSITNDYLIVYDDKIEFYRKSVGFYRLDLIALDRKEIKRIDPRFENDINIRIIDRNDNKYYLKANMFWDREEPRKALEKWIA